MNKLIEFQKEIKNWSIEEILDGMMKDYHWSCGYYNLKDEVKQEYSGRVMLAKMEIVSRFNKVKEDK